MTAPRLTVAPIGVAKRDGESWRTTWRLTNAERCTVYPKQERREALTVTETIRDAIVRHALDGITVRKAAAAPLLHQQPAIHQAHAQVAHQLRRQAQLARQIVVGQRRVHAIA